MNYAYNGLPIKFMWLFVGGPTSPKLNSDKFLCHIWRDR